MVHKSVSFLLFDAAHAAFCFHQLVGMCKLHMFGDCLKRDGVVAAFLSQHVDVWWSKLFGLFGVSL